MKVCRKCNKRKEWSEFSKCNSSGDGSQYTCKECFNKIEKQILATLTENTQGQQ